MVTAQKQRGRDSGKCATPTTRGDSIPRADDVSRDLVRVSGGAVVTDSLTIAREFGRRHDNVLRTICSLMADGAVGLLDSKETTYTDRWNRPQPCIELTERGALIAMPFVGGARAREGQVKLVDAFMRLRTEAVRTRTVDHIPQTLPEALRLAASLAEERAQLEQIVQHQAKKVAALDRLAAAEGSLNITAAAKSLKVRPQFLFDWLAQNRWIYRSGAGGAWTAYRASLMRGMLEHKTTTLHRDDGTEKVVAQVLVTAKGVVELSCKLSGGAVLSQGGAR